LGILNLWPFIADFTKLDLGRARFVNDAVMIKKILSSDVCLIDL
jgi:hypothetical protein